MPGTSRWRGCSLAIRKQPGYPCLMGIWANPGQPSLWPRCSWTFQHFLTWKSIVPPAPPTPRQQGHARQRQSPWHQTVFSARVIEAPAALFQTEALAGKSKVAYHLFAWTRQNSAICQPHYPLAENSLFQKARVTTPLECAVLHYVAVIISMKILRNGSKHPLE